VVNGGVRWRLVTGKTGVKGNDDRVLQRSPKFCRGGEGNYTSREAIKQPVGGGENSRICIKGTSGPGKMINNGVWIKESRRPKRGHEALGGKKTKTGGKNGEPVNEEAKLWGSADHNTDDQHVVAEKRLGKGKNA